MVTMPRNQPPCRASQVSRVPQLGQLGRAAVSSSGFVDCTTRWAAHPVRLHRPEGMQLPMRTCRVGAGLHGERCSAAGVVHPFAGAASMSGELPEPDVAAPPGSANPDIQEPLAWLPPDERRNVGWRDPQGLARGDGQKQAKPAAW